MSSRCKTYWAQAILSWQEVDNVENSGFIISYNIREVNYTYAREMWREIQDNDSRFKIQDNDLLE